MLNASIYGKLPNLKIVINAVKINDDDDGVPRYQGYKLMNYSREVRYLLGYPAHLVERIISFFEQR